MRRPGKIKKLVALAKSEEQRFGAIAGESQTFVAEQSAKLQELNNYRQSHAAKPLPAGAVSAQHWQDYHQFLQKLDLAIEAQRQIVCDGERNLQLHRERWLQKRRKKKSLQHMQDKATERQRIIGERIEQKQLDEISQSSFARQTDPKR